MQFFKSAAAATALLTSTASATWVLKVNSTLSGLPYIYPDTVSYANQTMQLGSAAENIYSEPIIASTKGSLGFTSYHQVPTGGQIPYVYLNAYDPVYYTEAHSGYTVPPGGNQTDFSFNEEGYLTYGGEFKFMACQNADGSSGSKYYVNWAGNSPSGGPGAALTCTGPIYLYQAEA